MEGRGGRNNFFDPFAGFGGFGGMGDHQNMFSSVFGGRDPFDDPFFTRPFGSMFESGLFGGNPFTGTHPGSGLINGNPFTGTHPGSGLINGNPFTGTHPGSGLINGNPFTGTHPGSGLFGGNGNGNPFTGTHPAGFIQQQESQPNKRRGPVIEELNSDDENGEDGGSKETKDNHPRKHSRLAREPYVDISDDETDDGKNKHTQYRKELNNRMNNVQPPSHSQCYTFQSSTVSYGGNNGAYYTKSSTRRAGSDGVVFEEFKEADSATGQANHRVSRGLHNKGHTLARKLNSDGKVDTRQTLRNLNEDELVGFEDAWEGSAGRHLTGGRLKLDGEHGSSGQTSRRGWALPSTQHQGDNSGVASGNHAGKRAADRGLHGRMRG